MLEVCFNDSVKGALYVAQHCGETTGDGPVCVITNKKGLFSFLAKRKAMKAYRKGQHELQASAVSLGGSREDVLGISFGLSEGDIRSPICLEDCPRKAHVRSKLTFERYRENADMDASFDEFWTACVNDFRRLQSKPKSIRVWLDCTPDAQCGLLFLADLLRDGKTEIHVVELPEKITLNDNYIIEYRGWGEVEPQRFGAFLENEKVLTEKEIGVLAEKWQLLKSENALLRVVENGSVISVDISYYDELIRKEFPKDALKIVQIIGHALVKQNILTDDVFIAKRIQHFIENGELVLSGKATKDFYNAVVKRAR